MHRPPRIQRLDPQQPLFDALAGQAPHAIQTGVRLLCPDRIAGLAVLADDAELRDLLDALIGVAIDLAARASQPGVVLIELAGNAHVEIRITAVADFANTAEEGANSEPPSSHELKAKAQRLGGILSTRTTPGVGMRMALTLPRVGGSSRISTPLRMEEQRCGTALHMGTSASERALLRLVCGALGPVSLMVAETPRQALDLMAANRPDLIMIDMETPGAEGLCETLRETPAMLAALSTHADDPAQRRRFRRLGANAVLARPLRLDDIACILRRALPPPGVTMVARG